MNLPSHRAIAINVVAVGLIGAAAFTLVRNALFPARAEACAARYFNEQTLPLRNGRAMLTIDDLQASLNGLDSGVIENLSVRELKEGPANAAIGAHYGAGSRQVPVYYFRLKRDDDSVLMPVLESYPTTTKRLELWNRVSKLAVSNGVKPRCPVGQRIVTDFIGLALLAVGQSYESRQRH